MLVRAGRKRKHLARYPGGKPKPQPRSPQPPDLPHRRGYGTDPRAATLHGRLFLDGTITGPQYVAGELYLVTLAKYWAAILAPGGLRSRGERRAQKERREEEDVLIVERFEAVLKALGPLVKDVDRILCEHHGIVTVEAYRAALDVLRGVYGL